MNESGQQSLRDLQVDRNNLYREEMFTDLQVASIRHMVPVKADGSPDNTREPIFVGQAQLMSQMGPLPVQCRLEARTLEEAIRVFPEAMEQAVEELIQEAQEMRRKESSRIVVPGMQPGGGGFNPGGPAGPGGKLHLG